MISAETLMRQSCKTVALLTSYPLVVPRHGGQIRSAQIVKALQKIGLNVVTVGVADPEGYSPEQLGPRDIFFPVESPFRLVGGMHAAYANDYLSGVYAAKDEAAYQRILATLPSRMDAIFVEQPWMLPVAQRLRVDRDVGALIYGSQNDETALKAPILRRYSPHLADELLSAINDQERAACIEADLVFAVSKADQSTLSHYCGNNVFLAPNGIEPWNASPNDLERWRRALAMDVSQFGLYVASAHPPNFANFFEVFQDRFGFLAPTEALCVAGGASAQIQRLLSGRDYEELSRSRLRFLGVVDATDLAAIKQLARAFVLPILDGSGSNLKTAEALFSGTWVVGTPMAFRGYEHFINLPHVIVADPGNDFCAAVKKAMASPPPKLTDLQWQSLRELTWDRTLVPMMEAIASRLGLEQRNETAQRIFASQ